MNGSDGGGGSAQGPNTYSTLAQLSDLGGTSNCVLAGDIGQAGTYLWSLPVGTTPGTGEGNYASTTGCLGSKLTNTTTQTGPGATGGPMFSAFHIAGNVNMVLGDGHAIGGANGTAIIAGCTPSTGNPTGQW
jgi:hypothetical protein